MQSPTTAVWSPGNSAAMLGFDLMVESSVVVVEAGRMPVEMTESLLAVFVSVVIAFGPTEKAIAEEKAAFDVEQQQATVADWAVVEEQRPAHPDQVNAVIEVLD